MRRGAFPIHETRTQLRDGWPWLSHVAGLLLLLLVTSSGCTWASSVFERDVVADGEHPFDLLPEATLVEADRLIQGDDGVQYRLAELQIARQSARSFLAPIRGPDDRLGIAHVDLDGGIRSWVTTPDEIENRGLRWQHFGVIGDTVWISTQDPRSPSFLLRGLDGEDLGESPVRGEHPRGDSAPGLLVHGNEFLDIFPDHFLHFRALGSHPVGLLVWRTGDGLQAADTLFHSFDRERRAASSRSPFQPFGEPPLHDVAVTGDRIVLVDWDVDQPADLSIRTIDVADNFNQSRSRVRLPHLEFPDEERQRILAAGEPVLDQIISTSREVQGMLLEHQSVGPIPEPGPESLQRLNPFPEYLPAARAVRLGEDGTIWLQRNELSPRYTQEDPSGPVARSWVMLDDDGTPQLQVTLPDGALFVLANRDEIWTFSLHDTSLTRWLLDTETPP